MADTLPTPPEPFTFEEGCGRFLAWSRREPVSALLLGLILGVLVFFFGFYKVFVDGSESAAVWAWKSWNSENDLEHGWAILPIAVYVAWYHRVDFAAARKESSPAGLAFVVAGVVLFVLSVRTLQGRVAMFAVPLLAYGCTRYLWGRTASRLVIFPCAFLLFMIPAGFLISRTVGLQTLAANVAAGLSNVLGIGVIADGVTIAARNGSFHFKVAGGCSGIRSLTAMTMLAALYVHFTQRELWKKAVIFGSSLFFALVGNLFRLFSVVLFARFINADIAGKQYHDWSGFVFFPIAVAAMVAFANLLNRDWAGILRNELRPDPSLNHAVESSPPGCIQSGAASAKGKPASPSPVSYDY